MYNRINETTMIKNIYNIIINKWSEWNIKLTTHSKSSAGEDLKHKCYL